MDAEEEDILGTWVGDAESAEGKGNVETVRQL
jgi:hypothetical protein